MRKLTTRMAVVLVLMLIALAPFGQVTGKEPSLPPACEQLAFSTEQHFVTHGPVPVDGNPIISDGDLLGFGCVVCARNLDLVEDFGVTVDLGLDAADVISSTMVAFSTELNSPNVDQLFTAGDLLVTNGVIIPNIALTDPFTVGHDIGLDAVHFVGDLGKITAFLDYAKQLVSRDDWLANPGMLSDELTRHEIDIWFSTEEGLGPVDAPTFLDGDLLSARDGLIEAANATLLPISVPAGIPNRGVDFGLDAVTSTRLGSQAQIHFSTDILYRDEVGFTDGDVLQSGNGVIYTNESLVVCFEPSARFLGLDALHIGLESLPRALQLPLVLRNFEWR